MTIKISTSPEEYVSATTRSGPVHAQGYSLRMVQHDRSVALCFESAEGPVCYVHGDAREFFAAVDALHGECGEALDDAWARSEAAAAGTPQPDVVQVDEATDPVTEPAEEETDVDEDDEPEEEETPE